MHRTSLSVGILSFFLLALCLPLFPADADAGPRWGEDRPGKGGGGGRNKAPTIGGTPSTVAEVGEYYAFQANATDREGDALKFSIANKPAWAAFDTALGFLSGFPDASDAGSTTSNIVISVSDGKKTASLEPFGITVRGTPNSPPVIDGSPSAEVIATQLYEFRPTASDPDQDPLRFSVMNKPGWANFDASTGQLSGTPGDVDVGVYGDIRITVTDGAASDSTNPFDISVVQTANGSVTLSWIAPTQNTDGTPLTDLAGYRIYYGTASRQYEQRVEIDSAGVLSAVIENLTPGTWYFAATAIAASGVESDPSAEVQRSIQ